MRRLAWLLFVCAAILVWPTTAPPAAANDVSADEFAHLVAEAVSGGSLADVTAVTSIDGQPVDMKALLDGTTREREARLETLNRLIGSAPPGFDGDTLRNQARAITSKPPFAAEVASNNGIFSRIISFIADALSTTAARGFGLVIIIALAFIVGYIVLDRAVTRRQVTSASTGPPIPSVDYRAAADTAAAGGNYAEALRMLFMDGAEHLQRLKAVPDAATTSTATVRPLADNPRFLDRFDAVAYGGAAAMSDDVADARRSWDALQERLESR
jgi:hypothetical protein